MPTTDDDIDIPQLAHLERCPKCTAGWLLGPTMATGYNTPKNKDRWYQMCSNKLDGSPLKCKFFKWRDVGPNPIPRGKPATGTPKQQCKGYVCTHGRGSRVINTECLFALCLPCCVHLHLTITGTPSCGCTKHDNALQEGRNHFHLPEHAVLPTITYPPYWQPPSPSSTLRIPQPEQDPDTVDDAPTPPRPRRSRGSHTRGGRGGRGGRGDAPPASARQGPGAASSTTTEAATGSACTGSNHRSTYAVSFSPVYDFTLFQAQMIEQQRLDQAAMSKQVGHAQMRMTEVFWWEENGMPARVIRVQIPNDPWFHPRDSAHLVSRFDLKSSTLFQFYDWRKESWLDGGFDSVPLHVDLSGELHFRSHGITWSTDMPGSSMPFPAPAQASSSSDMLVTARPGPSTPSSHARGKRPMQGPVIDLTEDDNASSSVTPTAQSISSLLLHRSAITSTPSSIRTSATPSSRFATPSSQFDTPSSVRVWSTPSQRSNSDYGTPSFLDDDWHGLAIDEAAPAASSPSSAVALSRSASSSTVTLSDSGLDLEPAPRGPSLSGWPWMYACDMIAGFRAMDALRSSGLKIPEAFKHAFRGHEFKHSTFNENRKAYKEARAVHGELERWSNLGRQGSGKWSEFRKQWLPKRT